MLGGCDRVIHSWMKLCGRYLFRRDVGGMNRREMFGQRDARLATATTAIPDGIAREPPEQFRWIAGPEVRVLARYRGKQVGIRHAAIVTPDGPRSQVARGS